VPFVGLSRPIGGTSPLIAWFVGIITALIAATFGLISIVEGADPLVQMEGEIKKRRALDYQAHPIANLN
jgi:hypothetical protein